MFLNNCNNITQNKIILGCTITTQHMQQMLAFKSNQNNIVAVVKNCSRTLGCVQLSQIKWIGETSTWGWA